MSGYTNIQDELYFYLGGDMKTELSDGCEYFLSPTAVVLLY
jgi:hypothetical protein